MDQFAALPQVEEIAGEFAQELAMLSEHSGLQTGGQDRQAEVGGQDKEQGDSEDAADMVNEPFLRVKHNHSVLPLTKEDAILYAQKGIDYDRIRASHDLIAALSCEEGISPEEWRKNLIRQRAEQKKGLEGGSSEEGAVAVRQAEQEKRLAQLEEEIAIRREQEKQMAEIAAFQKKYPEVPLDELPESVLTEVKAGVPLKYAYADYAYAVAQKKLAAYEANSLNATAATGSLSGSAEVQKDFYTKDEFYRLPEGRKNQLIDSGRIYDFMSKW